MTPLYVYHAAYWQMNYPEMVTAMIASVCIVTTLIVLCISACYATIEFRLMTQIWSTVTIIRANDVCMNQHSLGVFARIVL